MVNKTLICFYCTLFFIYFSTYIITFSDELIAAIKQVKTLLMEKADPSISRSQHEITEELDHVVANALSKSYNCDNFDSDSILTQSIRISQWVKITQSILPQSILTQSIQAQSIPHSQF